jgi:CubicO group peptidase (beta-lactamase class C family)
MPVVRLLCPSVTTDVVTYVDPTGTPADLASIGYDGTTWDRPWNLPRGQITTTERMPSALLAGGPAVEWPVGESLDLGAVEATDPLMGRATDVASLLRDRAKNDGVIVVRHGRVVAEAYADGLTPDDHHLVHSCSKTLTTMMIGVAIGEGRLDPASAMHKLVEELRGIQAWSGVTLQHVLDMAVGLDTDEHYEDDDSMYWRYADAVGYYEGVPEERQIGTLGFVTAELTRRVDAPGTRFNYASYLTNLLPVVLERTYGRPAVELYEERLYSRIGAQSHAIVNLDRFANPIVEGQVSLTLRDFARWAYPFMNEGRGLGGLPVVPQEWVDEAFRPDAARRSAFARSDYADALPGGEYHNQAWLLDPEAGTLAMLGIHGQFAFMNRDSGLLVAGMSSFPAQANPLLISTMTEMWRALSGAA